MALVTKDMPTHQGPVHFPLGTYLCLCPRGCGGQGPYLPEQKVEWSLVGLLSSEMPPAT